MKKLPLGLVIEGNSTSSTLLRLTALAAELGPIKSSGLQVARRVSNFLRGGYAVHSYEELASARTILLRAPDEVLERLVGDLAQADLDWVKHSFVLCETWLPTSALKPLQENGSHIASLVLLRTGLEKTFVVEGDLPAVRHIRRMIERSSGRTIELKADSKHLLFAAATLCAAIPVPVLSLARKTLRESGISGNHLTTLLEGMFGEMLSTFLKGPRTLWGGPLADSTEASQSVYWRELEASHPAIFEALTKWLLLSNASMGKK